MPHWHDSSDSIMNQQSKFHLRQILPALLAIGLVTWWLGTRHAAVKPETQVEENPLNADFDYFISGMNRTTFANNNGQLHHLEAAEVRHYPSDDRAELEQPRFSWFVATNKPWTVQSVTGQLSRQANEKADLLELEDQVRLSKPLPDGDTLVVETAKLDVDIATKSFTTAEPVSLSSATMQLESRGMTGELDSNRLELLNEVSGRHE